MKPCPFSFFLTGHSGSSCEVSRRQESNLPVMADSRQVRRLWLRSEKFLLSVVVLTLGLLIIHAQEGVPPQLLPATPIIEPVPIPTFNPQPNPLPEQRRVLQPVHRYQNVEDPQSVGRHEIQQKMNPFLSYSYLGTDFGFIGAGEGGLGWEVGTVCISMPPGYWGGMWHSLAGLGSDQEQSLDFRACYPAAIKPRFQPKVVGFEMGVRGKGSIKIEIKSAKQEILWFHSFPVDSTDLHTVVEQIKPDDIGPAKFLNWVAESGTDACLDSVNLVVQTPDIPFDEYVFLSSYAKLARCYSPRTGFVRDRAHISDGSFDNVPAAGFFAVATALAARRGIVDEEYARGILAKIHDGVAKLDNAGGLLPHFIQRRPDGVYAILPGTEFSTVDTSIYYHCMLLAAQLLHDSTVLAQLTESVHHISYADMVDSAGFIRQGVREDKTSPLPGSWRDWGGETALVLALASMSQQPPVLRMERNARINEGSGFIAEVQSLFYPDFDSPKPDAISGQNWQAVRRNMLLRQKEYFPKNWPESKATALGLYGLSAGEARRGLGYSVGGVDLPSQTLIHPHYILMSACLDPHPDEVHDLLRRMEKGHLFPPWGMVENVTKNDADEYLPMQCALNAGFECLGAYHLLARHRGIKDDLYEASQENPDLRKAAAMFYPSDTASFTLGSKTSSPSETR